MPTQRPGTQNQLERGAALEGELEQALVALEDAREYATRLEAERARLEAVVEEQARKLNSPGLASPGQNLQGPESKEESIRAQMLELTRRTDAWKTERALAEVQAEELQVAMEEMQVLTEELEGVNEELRGANEELEARVAARTRQLEEANAALRENEQRFRLAQRYALAGTWDWDIKTGIATWSEEYFDVCGLNPADVVPSREAWIASIHPDDREHATRALDDGLKQKNPDFALEYRIVHPTQGERWLASRGRLILDDQGQPARLVGLNIDVTDRRRAEVEAQEANRAKSRFLAAASHDLRQPVTAAALSLDLLLRKIRDPETKRLADMVNMSLEGLRGMLNSLLDVARLEAGVVRPELSPFALDELLQRLASELKGVVQAANLSLRVPQTGLTVKSDQMLLELILRNLLSNAVKYTPRGGITVSAVEHLDQVRIDVADSGIGISAPALERIFEEFYQADTPARGQGYGIGLSTVRRVADLLGYRLDVTSEPGRGSTFSISVPLAEPTETVAMQAKTAAMGEHGLSGPILVVDDEPMIMQAMGMLLADWGMEMVAATSVEQAREIIDLRSLAFPLILTDYQLGDGTGLEVVQMARQLGDTPAILLTGDTDPQMLGRLDSPGLHLLHKPIDPGRLHAVICAAVSRD